MRKWMILLLVAALLTGRGGEKAAEKAPAPEPAKTVETSEPAKTEKPAAEPVKSMPMVPEALPPGDDNGGDVDRGVSLVTLQQLMTDWDAIAGAAYLGTYGGAFPSWEEMLEPFTVYGEHYPFIYDIPGNELISTPSGRAYFCVAPRDDMASVSVNLYGSNGEVQEVLYRSEYGNPIMLSINADGQENVEVTVVAPGGRVATWRPQLDFTTDRMLPPGEGWYDFSLYTPEKSELIGSWTCGELYDTEGHGYMLSLDLHQDGRAAYVIFNLDTMDVLARFEGEWHLQPDTVQHMGQFDGGYFTLSMYLTEGSLPDGSDGSVEHWGLFLPELEYEGTDTFASYANSMMLYHDMGENLVRDMGWDVSYIQFFRTMG